MRQTPSPARHLVVAALDDPGLRIALQDAMEILGHSDPQTTLSYKCLDLEALRVKLESPALGPKFGPKA